MVTILPPTVYPDPIVQGADWTWKFLAVDSDDSTDFDWTDETWVFSAAIKDRSGSTLATLGNAGGEEGTISGDADGLLTLSLSSTVTASLPLTRQFSNITDPSIATWRSRGNYFFDLRAVCAALGVDDVLVHGVVTVQEAVTEDEES